MTSNDPCYNRNKNTNSGMTVNVRSMLFIVTKDLLHLFLRDDNWLHYFVLLRAILINKQVTITLSYYTL